MTRRLSFAAVLLATLFMLAREALADVVLDWNEIGLARAMAAKQLPPDAARTLALMHVAMFDAVNAIERRYRHYAFEGSGDGAASPEAAGVAAAHATLLRLFPHQVQTLDAAYAASMSRIPDGDAKAAGVALGRAAALRCLQARAEDGSGRAGLYKPRVQAGLYVATAHPVSSEWARVKPFIMNDAAQFRPPPPPPLDGEQWSRDLHEIQAIGGRTSAGRSAEQTDVARFWAITGPASWNPLVRVLTQARPSSLVEHARLFALVNMAATDAFIAVFDAKYAYEFWRPVTAVRHAVDPTWLPLLDTPMHPEYPCAHCISAAAVAAVLEAHFGTGPIPTVTMTSPTAPGVTRSWSRIQDYVREVSSARIWGGIHYRNSTDVGQEMGRRIGALAIQHQLASRALANRAAAPEGISAR